MKTSSIKSRRLIFISLLILVGIWMLLSNLIDNNIYLPKINEVINELNTIVFNSSLVKDVVSSIFRGLESLIISLLLALLLGVASSFNKYIYNFIFPLIVILKSIPNIAFILIALIWVNKDYAPLLIGIVVSFPIFYEVVQNSILNIEENLLEMIEAFKIGFKDTLLNIHIPNIFFNIQNIISSTFSLILKIVIAGEVYGQPKFGIGTSIQGEKMNFNTAGIFAWIIIVALLCFLIDKVILYIGEQLIKGRREFID
ncbi:ABC transporter permease subunit [Clostridium carnis]